MLRSESTKRLFVIIVCQPPIYLSVPLCCSFPASGQFDLLLYVVGPLVLSIPLVLSCALGHHSTTRCVHWLSLVRHIRTVQFHFNWQILSIASVIFDLRLISNPSICSCSLMLSILRSIACYVTCNLRIMPKLNSQKQFRITTRFEKLLIRCKRFKQLLR